MYEDSIVYDFFICIHYIVGVLSVYLAGRGGNLWSSMQHSLYVHVGVLLYIFKAACILPFDCVFSEGVGVGVGGGEG